MSQKFRKSTFSPSSVRWLRRHQNDRFVKQARLLSYRSRSAYKLVQLDDQDHVLRLGDHVIDLGAAPGGWTQVAVTRVGSKPNAEHVFAVDKLPMSSMVGAKIIQGDFLTIHVQSQLEAIMLSPSNASVAHSAKLDVVLSDLSPNISGIRDTDNAKAMRLSESALKFACTWLKSGGRFVCKLFHSQESETLIRQSHQHFSSVKIRKPEASRQESREFFLVAAGFERT